MPNDKEQARTPVVRTAALEAPADRQPHPIWSGLRRRRPGPDTPSERLFVYPPRRPRGRASDRHANEDVAEQYTYLPASSASAGVLQTSSARPVAAAVEQQPRARLGPALQLPMSSQASMIPHASCPRTTVHRGRQRSTAAAIPRRLRPSEPHKHRPGGQDEDRSRLSGTCTSGRDERDSTAAITAMRIATTSRAHARSQRADRADDAPGARPRTTPR